DQLGFGEVGDREEVAMRCVGHVSSKRELGGEINDRRTARASYAIPFPIRPTTSLRIAPDVPMFTRQKHAPCRPKSSPRITATFPFARKTFAGSSPSPSAEQSSHAR